MIDRLVMVEAWVAVVVRLAIIGALVGLTALAVAHVFGVGWSANVTIAILGVLAAGLLVRAYVESLIAENSSMNARMETAFFDEAREAHAQGAQRQAADVALRILWRESIATTLGEPSRRAFEVALADPTRENLARAAARLTDEERFALRSQLRAARAGTSTSDLDDTVWLVIDELLIALRPVDDEEGRAGLSADD